VILGPVCWYSTSKW